MCVSAVGCTASNAVIFLLLHNLTFLGTSDEIMFGIEKIIASMIELLKDFAIAFCITIIEINLFCHCLSIHEKIIIYRLREIYLRYS